VSRVTFRAQETGNTMSAALGGAVKVQIGPKWEEIERPRRSSYTDWKGDALKRQIVPVLLDGWAARRSVEGQLDFLRHAADGGDNVAPAVLTMSGPTIYHGELAWVIETYEEGDDTLYDDDGTLLRQTVTLGMVRYVRPDITARSKNKNKNKGKKVYKSKKGDTLQKIAKKKLGAANKWKVLRKLNPKLRNPRKPLKVGTPVRYA
jgi:hypothetical protein